MFLLLFVTPWNTPQVQLSKLFKLWTTLGCNQQLAARTILLTARVKNRTSPLGNIIAYFCLQNASLGIYNKHITCTTSIVLTWCQFPYHQNWQKVASIFASISKQLKHKDLYQEFHETCHSVTFIVLVNSHKRWKQTQNRVCFHLWCELTLALWCHSII